MEKKSAITEQFTPNEIENLLFHILRTFYQFEQIEVEKFGLSYDLIYILKLLQRIKILTISDIAKEMKIKIFTATRLTDQLEKRSFIKRQRSNEDKRFVKVTITSSGTKMVKRIEEHAVSLIFSNLGGYSREEIFLLFKTIKNIDKILGIGPGDFNFEESNDSKGGSVNEQI